MVAPSREYVECFYCKLRLQRRALVKHTARVHPGFRKREIGSSFARYGLFDWRVVSSDTAPIFNVGAPVDLFVASGSRIPPVSTVSGSRIPPVSTVSGSKIPLVSTASGSGIPPVSSASGSRKPPVSTASETMDTAVSTTSESMVSPIDTASEGSVHLPVCDALGESDDIASVIHAIYEKLNLITSEISALHRDDIFCCLKRMESLIDDIAKQVNKNTSKASKSGQQASQTKDDHSDVIAELYTKKTIDDLLKLPTIERDTDLSVLYCLSCVENASQGFGVFKLLPFADETTRSRCFRNLKGIIKCHLTSPKHITRSKEKNDAVLENDRLLTEASKTACRVLKTGYYCLKHSHSKAEFERLIVLQHGNGAKMGNICHSGAQLMKMRSDMHDVITCRISNHCTHSPCISIVADKVTVNHRTVDIQGIITIIPEADPTQLIQAFVVGAPLVNDHGGEAMAKVWLSTMENLGLTLRNVAAIGADGQIHHNGVPQHFARMMDQGTCDGFVPPAYWDGGHLLELGVSSTNKEFPWVKFMITVISEVSKMFHYGSALTKLMNIDPDALTPVIFSDTRWCAYAAQVIRVFLKNLPTYLKIIRQQPSDTSLSCEVVRRLLDDEETVCFQASALLDIFNVLGRCSKLLQDLQALPWERDDAFSVVIERLGLMCSSLPSVTSTSLRTHRLSVEQVAQQVNIASNEELVALWPHFCELESVPQLPMLNVRDYLKQLIENIKGRRMGVDARGNSYGCSNRLLHQLMSDVRMIADLKNVATSSPNRVGFMERSASKLVPNGVVPSYCLPVNFAVARSSLRRLNSDDKSIKDLLKLLHKEARTEPELTTYIGLVTRLWLLVSNESIVESMGSIIKEVFGVHRNLLPVNAAKELAIRWNGPAVHNAHRLVNLVRERGSYRFTKTSGYLTSSTVTQRQMSQPDPKKHIF